MCNSHSTSSTLSIKYAIISLLKRWLFSRQRPMLLGWSFGFFSMASLPLFFAAFRYLSACLFPGEFLAMGYIISAFISHFASIMLIVWAGLILPLVVLIPARKVIIPVCTIAASLIITTVLLDSHLYTSHRFHFSMLTIRILGWKTWGFGLFFIAVTLIFNAFLSRIAWNRYVVQRKKLHSVKIISAIVALLLFTHGTHIWADAVGYSPVTSFTTTLPMFYPATGKKQMVRLGLVDMADRRGKPRLPQDRSGLKYPLAPLVFTPHKQMNILIIAVDAMRHDMLTGKRAPNCTDFARKQGLVFTNHWSGGNSTKMGMFSLFYGIPPTYQQYVESNKISPVLMDRLMEEGYQTGIFTSHPLYRPACMDVTVFVKVNDLRLETSIPGPKIPWRNDSAITGQWVDWLDNRDAGRPFFGLLFYDALCGRSFPSSFEKMVTIDDRASAIKRDFARYKVSMLFVDSLIGEVLTDLSGRGLMDSTVVIITSDHGNEFDDNGVGIRGHGSAFSDFQLRVPLVVHWPGKENGIIDKRTSHNDIVATLMRNALCCCNPAEDYCCGVDLYSEKEWDWLIAGSYYNFAIIEPNQVTIQFPGGYYEVRDHSYRFVKNAPVSMNISAALTEMGRFFKK